MRNSLRNITYLFFFGLFELFALFTIALFIIYKPIASSLRYSGSSIWYAYVAAILLAAVFVWIVVKVFLKCCSFIFYNRFLLISSIVLITAIPRIIWINLVNVVPVSDFATFNAVATQIVNGNVTGNNYISLFPHVIGYSTFLSLFYRIFGCKVIVAQLLNIALGCGISVTLFFIGKKIFDERCGYIAAIVWALWPSHIMYNSLVASEELFTFLNLLCILFFIHITKYKDRYYKLIILFIILGILCAIANAVRPLSMVLIIAAGIFYFIFTWENNKPVKSQVIIKIIAYSALFISFFLAGRCINLLISNTLRQEVARTPIGFSAFVGSNINSGGAWNTEDSKVLLELMEKYGKQPQDIHDELLKRAVERYKSQSFQNLTLLLKKHKIMWTTENDILVYIKAGLDMEKPSRMDFLRNYNRLNLINNLYYYMILIFCVISGYIMIKKLMVNNEYQAIFLLIFISGMIAVHMIVEVAGRYHYPAVPIFALVSSYGLVNTEFLQYKLIRTNKINDPGLQKITLKEERQ